MASPIPIPDDIFADFLKATDGKCQRVVYTGPPGVNELDINPVEALTLSAPGLPSEIYVLVEFSPKDQALLQENGWRIWLNFAGQMPPWCIVPFEFDPGPQGDRNDPPTTPADNDSRAKGGDSGSS